MTHPERVLIYYTNHKGETAWRDIRPDRISFENNEWHHDSQWILYAFDYSRNAERGFAIKDIQEWKTQ